MKMVQLQQTMSREILAPLGENASTSFPDVTGFLPLHGKMYSSRLMVVGRAVNGWHKSVSPAAFKSSQLCEDYSKSLLDPPTERKECPMRWVSDSWKTDTEYNTATSAFWRVIRSMVDELNIADVDSGEWCSHLVWSNLYKISPSKGGNPSSALMRLQFPGCLAMLKQELSIFRPDRVVFMTGVDWVRPFLDDMDAEYTSSNEGQLAEAYGVIRLDNGHKTKMVVSAHPQGKGDRKWVSQTLDAFKLIG